MTTNRKLALLVLTAWPLAHVAIRSLTTPTGSWKQTALAEFLTAGLLVGLGLFYAVKAWRSPGMAQPSRVVWAAALSLPPLAQLALAVPVGVAGLMVTVENALGWGIFDPALGADPILVQHVRWYEAHRFRDAVTVVMIGSQVASWYLFIWRAPPASTPNGTPTGTDGRSGDQAS